MKIKSYIIALLSLLFILASPGQTIAKKDMHDLDQQDYIKMEMNLLNAYLVSINAQLKRPEPQMDEFHILAELFLDTAYKIKRTKHGKVFHQNLKNLLRDVKSLKKLSKANKYEAALTQAKSIQNNCIACHINLPVGKQNPK